MRSDTIVHPTTGEILFAPRPGVTIYSRSRFYNDHPEMPSPVGGHIIDIGYRYTDKILGVTEPLYTVVCWKWGNVRYDKIPESDIDWTQYNGGIYAPQIRKLRERLDIDNDDDRYALLVLSNVLANQ